MLTDPLSIKKFYGGLANEDALWNACRVKDNLGDSAVAYLRRFVSRENVDNLYKYEITHLLERCVLNCKLYVFPRFPRELLSPEGFRTRASLCFLATDDIQMKYMGSGDGPYTLHGLAETHNLASIPKPGRLNWRVKRLNYLIRAGLDPNGYNDEGLTPLLALVHLSGEEEDSDMAELAKHLISHGANVHQRNREDKTALWLAVKRGLRATIGVLIKHGAKPCAKSANGTSILAAAYRRLRRASLDPQRYGMTTACMTTVIDRGAIAEPSPLQEWSIA